MRYYAVVDDKNYIQYCATSKDRTVKEWKEQVKKTLPYSEYSTFTLTGDKDFHTRLAKNKLIKRRGFLLCEISEALYKGIKSNKIKRNDHVEDQPFKLLWTKEYYMEDDFLLTHVRNKEVEMSTALMKKILAKEVLVDFINEQVQALDTYLKHHIYELNINNIKFKITKDYILYVETKKGKKLELIDGKLQEIKFVNGATRCIRNISKSSFKKRSKLLDI